MDNEDFDNQEQHIVYLRLITGDEIVGECIGELENSEPQTIILKSPMVMSEILNPYTQSMSITLSKYMVFGSHDVMPIRMDHVVSMTTPIKELEDFYNTSVVFNQEIANKEVAEEIERANEATITVINSERKNADFDEKITTEAEGKNLILPSNTNIH